MLKDYQAALSSAGTETVGICEVCGAPAEMIPYQDVSGCGATIIELWRCQRGHVRYGNVIGYAACDDFEPPESVEL